MKATKKQLTEKWLSGDLTPEERESFKKLDDYDSYVKISEKAKYFKAPDFDQESSFEQIKPKLQNSSKAISSLFKYAAAIAAILIVSFAAIYFSNTATSQKSYETALNKSEPINLPDQSEVILNSNSILSYDQSSWDDNRFCSLDGEAFFKVKTGQKFTVNTTYGDVQVLGTQFNVKSRSYSFRVDCYEGAVQVSVDDKNYILRKNESLSFENDNISILNSNTSKPDWKNNQSILKSKPLKVVLEEFKNYYDVNIDASNVDTSRRFTGSFTHDNIKIALKSITLPLGITYNIKGNNIVLINK